MRADPSNPPGNQLPAGIQELEFVKAIEASGYPLQGIVASKLNQQFSVTEEWGYIDRDTQEHRSLDVFAYKPLVNDQGSSVQPRLVLLIECQRSRHPYVFFKIVTNRSILRYKGSGSAVRVFPTLILCLSVLDAPIVLIESPTQANDPMLTPWVRVVRQEANPSRESWEPASRFYAIDVVHADVFDEVIHKHLLPFTEEFGKRAVQLGGVLLRGGKVPNLDNWEWDRIKET